MNREINMKIKRGVSVWSDHHWLFSKYKFDDFVQRVTDRFVRFSALRYPESISLDSAFLQWQVCL